MVKKQYDEKDPSGECAGKYMSIQFVSHDHLFVWGFTPYQWYFSCLMLTVHKSIFPRQFINRYLTSTLSWHWRANRSAIPIIMSAKGERYYFQFKRLVCCGRGSNPWAPPGWLSGERVGLMTRWMWVRSPFEATFLSGVFSPLTSAEACEESCWWLWKEKLC